MRNQNKYIVAGSIVAGVGTVYAIQRSIDVDIIGKKIEENKEAFFEFIEELVDLGMELLEKILKFIKKLIKHMMFKVKMLFNV